jgi:hypothetical protein
MKYDDIEYNGACNIRLIEHFKIPVARTDVSFVPCYSVRIKLKRAVRHKTVPIKQRNSFTFPKSVNGVFYSQDSSSLSCEKYFRNVYCKRYVRFIAQNCRIMTT